MIDTCEARAPGVVAARQEVRDSQEWFREAIKDSNFSQAALAGLHYAASSVVAFERSAQFVRTYSAEADTRQKYPMALYKHLRNIASAIVNDLAEADPVALATSSSPPVEYPPLKMARPSND